MSRNFRREKQLSRCNSCTTRPLKATSPKMLLWASCSILGSTWVMVQSFSSSPALVNRRERIFINNPPVVVRMAAAEEHLQNHQETTSKEQQHQKVIINGDEVKSKINEDEEESELLSSLDGGPPSITLEPKGIVEGDSLVSSVIEDYTNDHQHHHPKHLNIILDKLEQIPLLPPPTLPRHKTNKRMNDLLKKSEGMMRSLHSSMVEEIQELETSKKKKQKEARTPQLVEIDDNDTDETSTFAETGDSQQTNSSPTLRPHLMESQLLNEQVFANSYVDLGKIDTIGFDFDYTLVTYSNELLSLIYDMALERLVQERHYPIELQHELKGKFDAFFSIRGLAVDKETGWICHLSYTHKVAVAWEGRRKLPSSRLREEYASKRSLSPAVRKKRLKPLNDLFSMAECCLIADIVEFFKTRNIPFFPSSIVADILQSIGRTHISGDFHRLVAANPQRYFEPKPHLRSVLETLHGAGKRLIFVSNSPFWYVDAGMKYVMGPNWRDMWDVVIVSAGKPAFYTEDARPFREVSARTGRIKFKRIDRIEPGEVYTEGSLKEMTRCLQWTEDSASAEGHIKPLDTGTDNDKDRLQRMTNAGYSSSFLQSKVLYIGDSLFADLVDAKREFGWTTAAVTPEVEYELELQRNPKCILTQQTIELLTHTLRKCQTVLGNSIRSSEDTRVVDEMEQTVSQWRDYQSRILGNPFGSVFRARFQPSLFAHSLRRYCDLYMADVESLRHYSPQHRFYPEDASLLGHEIQQRNNFSIECWTEDLWGLDDI